MVTTITWAWGSDGDASHVATDSRMIPATPEAEHTYLQKLAVMLAKDLGQYVAGVYRISHLS